MKVRDTLLLVDNKPSDRKFLREIFEDSYHILEAENREQAFLLLTQNQSCIAAVLLDMDLPRQSGLTLFNEIVSRGLHAKIPICAMVRRGRDDLEAQAFDLGADDVLIKPFRPTIIQRRVKAVVELYHQKWNLETLVEEQTEILRRSNESIVDSLCAIIETRSAESGLHILRIRRFTCILLEEVARSCPEYELDEHTIQIVTSAAALHDIGKIGIPDAILNKPGKLDPDEFDIMKDHTLIGSRMLEELSAIGNDEYLRYAHNICHYHHERWDGKGYPEGLREDDIPICAQVVGLADVYDALTTDRVYKAAIPHEQAANMILNGECGQFSPKLLECFKLVRGEFALLAQTYADGLSPKSDSITAPLMRPSPKDIGLDSLQSAHAKLRTLMHYLDSTVAEVDLDNNVFHLLYNPHPEFTQMHTAASLEAALSQLAEEVVHPSDRALITDDLSTYLQSFFDSGLRRNSRRYRIYHSAAKCYHTYEGTALRIDSGDPNSRQMLALWTPVEKLRSQTFAVGMDAQTALQGIMGVIRCTKDRRLTLEYAAGCALSMAGYTAAEVEEQFQNSFLSLVADADRETLLQNMDIQLRTGNTLTLEFRMRHKNGSLLWVQAKGRVVLAEDGIERLHAVLNDISPLQAEKEQLQKTLKRHQIIMGQSDDIVFELDIATDTLNISAKWDARFGYPPITKNFTKQLLRASHFHPEDLETITHHLRRIQNGISYVELEARIANNSGRYLWNQIRATVQRDADGVPAQLIGVIIDIDSEKRAAQALLNQAERDSLTKLFNKEAARRRVEEYLLSCGDTSRAAMLIIDLDNFKAVNDRYGHLFGDVVLTRAADEIRGLFRESDVLARIGGDEFMVFMKNIPGEDLVKTRCEKLLDIFRTLYREQLESCGFSCSIGVSFFPDYGSAYQELFRRADWALYQAKRQGRNAYQFYHSRMTGNALLPMVHTRIDSNAEPGIAQNSLLHYVFNNLYDSGDVDGTVNAMLELLGNSMNVSRVYIFENSPDNRTCSNTFEWCNTGITPEIQNLQEINYETDIPGYEKNFDERGIFYCPDTSQLPPEQYEILEPQGIKSMLQCAIRDNGQFRGYVGFDECNGNRLWTQEQIDLLTLLSQTISLFLLKKRAQVASETLVSDLRNVLDKQQSWVYIIDPDTYEILFMNARAKDLSPDAHAGIRCYEAFLGGSSNCENCPARSLRDPEAPHFSIIQNQKLGLSIYTQAAPIHWQGRSACLISCHEAFPSQADA